MPRPQAAIVGIHEYPSRSMSSGSAWQIKAISAGAALADAGLNASDVDALYDAGELGENSGQYLTQYLGLRPKIVDTTSLGGASFEFHVAHAVDAISAGRAKVALLTYGSTARMSRKAIGTAAPGATFPALNLETPWGSTLISGYAMVAERHQYQYGTTAEQLAEIAVLARMHALRNPAAVAGLTAIGIAPVPLTISDVLASGEVSSPLHRLDCCLITDGGGAVVIAAADVAAGTRQPPAWILGSGEAVEHLANDRDITVTAAAQSGPRAFRAAGLTPADVDVAMVYDSFTITALAVLEDLGFCEKGEGGALAASGRLAFDRPGGPAVNTDGGGLSSNHPGMRGIFLLIEAARQLRGISTSQVPGAAVAIAHGNGGVLSGRHSGATVILGRDR